MAPGGENMIDELLYYPHFCMAAVAATGILFVMYFMKRNFPGRSNRIFFMMLIDNLLASAINILTFYTISFPERYPLWLCNLSNILYLFVYNLMSVLFLLYVDSMAKIPVMEKPVRIFAAVILSYDGIMLALSPYTHLMIYFDEQRIYRHGSFMVTLYINAFLAVLFANTMFIAIRKRFNFYQVFSIIGFSLGVFASVIFQVNNPRYVISNFVCAMVLFFLYSAFENPAYYMHGDTTCYNRRAFMKTIHAYKKRRKPYTMILIQIGDFDGLVHSLARTEVFLLSERIAERISRLFRKTSYCIDTDRFVLVEDITVNVEQKAKLVREIFANPFQVENGSEVRNMNLQPVISVLHITDEAIDGHEMAEILQNIPEHSLEETVRKADISELLLPIRREKEILRLIDNAVKTQGFEVYYQPIYDVNSGKFHSAEALIRLKNESGNFISPEEFIPIAEKNGRIESIGAFVFREVCRFMRDTELASYGVRYVEINLSPEQCREMAITDQVISIMKEYGVQPSQLNLEITETAQMENGGMVRLGEIMSRLHKENLTFSLDDFGSGFAAINYLIRFPVDIVKIDKEILWHAMKDETSMIVLKSTIQMIKEIGRKIVVEGIETKEMAQLLIENGCDYLQGYYYSKPIPGDRYLEFLKGH